METSNIHDNDQEIRERILIAARDQFFQFGFSRVTVDEIAAKLGMSKKTLYKFFPSKEGLIHEVAQMEMHRVNRSCVALYERQNLNFVQKLKEIMTIVGMQYAKIRPPLLHDLQKAAPHVWDEISEFRAKTIKDHFGQLLDEGVKAGVFRSDINKDLILLIYANCSENIINPDILAQIPFSASQVFEAIITVLFEGIITPDSLMKYRTQPASNDLLKEQ